MKQTRDIEALRHELKSRSEQSSSSNVPIFGLRPKASPVQTFPPPGLDLSSKVRVRSSSTKLRRDGPRPMILMAMTVSMNRHPQLRTRMMVIGIHQAQIKARAEAVGNHLPAIPVMTMITTTTMTKEMMKGRRARRTRRRRRTKRRRARRTRRRSKATRNERVDLLPTRRALHRPAPQHHPPHHHHRRKPERSARSSTRSWVNRRPLRTQTTISPRSRKQRGLSFPLSHFLRVTGIGASRFGKPCVRRPIAPMTLSSGAAECGSLPS